MSDTTDHTAAIYEAAGVINAAQPPPQTTEPTAVVQALDRILDAADALAAERNALAAKNASLREAMEAALERHDHADAEINHVGFVRGSVAWAMADDLRQALADHNVAAIMAREGG